MLARLYSLKLSCKVRRIVALAAVRLLHGFRASALRMLIEPEKRYDTERLKTSMTLEIL